MSAKYKKHKRISLIFLTIAASFTVAACSATSAQKAGFDPESSIEDPFENTNRVVFAMNETLDHGVGMPVARGYRSLVPQPVRNSVRNFLRNLRSPINIANQALQGDVEGAAKDTSRAMMNTVIGVGGLFDVAAETGIEYEYEDFGQTLAVWGVDHGPYWVLPIFGPSSVRDATGFLVDTLADPVRIYLYNTDQEGLYYARAITAGIDRREELLEAIDDLRKNSFDFYAAARSAYYQKRHAMVRDENPDDASSVMIPDYSKEQ